MKSSGVALLVACLVLACPARAQALPVYAHRYGLSCEACHTTVPHLSPFGTAFLRAGFRLPSTFTPSAVFPVALKVNLQYSSHTDPSGLPKAIVDEIELLAGGTLTRHWSYRLEQYLVDGGVPGITRDAWLQFTSRPTFGDEGAALRMTAGQFTLPLPVDPETQRETINHYQLFDQQVGANPFNFFNDAIGADVAFGRDANGSAFHALALKGHDPQSGLPTSGVDAMAYVQSAGRNVVGSAYYYVGTRRFASVVDGFHRQGLAVTLSFGKLQADLVAQRGNDSAATALAAPATSSGGFAQARWAFSPALTALCRYDSTNDSLVGLRESLTTTFVVRVRRNSKVTIEDVAASGHQTLNAAFLFAY
jgi:hypothetical protein